MDNTNNTRFNMPMSSIDSKGLQYLSDRLSKNPNSRFVCAIARLNPKGTAYIGMNKSGKEFVTIPVVADYADKAAHYAGLSDKEDGAGLFYFRQRRYSLCEHASQGYAAFRHRTHPDRSV